MAKGKSCYACGYAMYAEKEEYQPKGTWVTYQCRACAHKEKIFESN
ncbi:MAG: hypothetical protein LBS50_04575 [Prevotellaceae bacterium]|jgi:ribosomal protein S27E|nr:hypothetical protein [Prevotellaceae bacterium]